MEKIPANLLYSKEHEWVKGDGDVYIVGITHHAQAQLGDVVFIELPEVGRELHKDKVFGVVESVKAVSDLYAPITGEVVAVNTEIVDSPEGVNESPYEGAWLIKIKSKNQEEISELMNASDYESYLKELSK